MILNLAYGKLKWSSKSSLQVKEIFSDSNNIFLWHESEDTEKKREITSKFQLIPLLRLQVMYDYIHWHCSIDYGTVCVKLSLVNETLCQKLVSFHKEVISA